MNIKESIKNVLSMNGTVSIPYKIELKSWYGEIKIYKIDDEYIISGSCKHTNFSNIDTAVNYFCELSLSSKNYGYLHQRLLDKKLIDIDFDFEDISKSNKKKFKNEGILADIDLANMGVTKTQFPDIKKSEEDFEQISKTQDIDELKIKIKTFNDNYMSILDSNITVSAVFINDDGEREPYDYRISFHKISEFSMEYINNIEAKHSQLTFKCISLHYKINNNFIFQEIYLNKKASE